MSLKYLDPLAGTVSDHTLSHFQTKNVSAGQKDWVTFFLKVSHIFIFSLRSLICNRIHGNIIRCTFLQCIPENMNFILVFINVRPCIAHSIGFMIPRNALQPTKRDIISLDLRARVKLFSLFLKKGAALFQI